MLTDTHCHIFSEDYEDIAKIIDNAKQNGVCKYINNASNIQSCYEVLELSKKYDSMYAALGIHPEFVNTYSEDDLDKIIENLGNQKVVAIGEIGLDYHYEKDSREKQIELFSKQLKIAQDHDLPVIIHNREATQDTINTLKKYKVRGVIHCFNGSLETAKEYINMGFALGINGVITFKNCKLKEVIKNIDINNIVLETDCPYLTPEPNRGKKNEPKYVLDIANFIANIYNISLNQVEKITNDNVRRIFDI